MESAEPLTREALQIWQKRVGAGCWQAIATESQLGSILLTHGHRDEAEALLAPSYQALRERFGPRAEITRLAYQRLAE